jgi:hypothetical protein
MAGPGGWSTTGPNFSHENNLQFFRSDDNSALEEVPFRDLNIEDKYPTIEASDSRQVLALESRSSRLVGFDAPESFVSSICTKWKIPRRFLDKIFSPGSLSRLDYLLETSQSSDGGDVLSGVNIGFRWGAGHSNHVIVLGRFEVASSRLRLILSSRDLLDLQSFRYQQPHSHSPAAKAALLAGERWEHPMDIFGHLLLHCERYVDLISQESNIEILQTGKTLESLYSPQLTHWTSTWNIQPKDGSQKKMDSLFECYNDVTWGEKGCKELIDLCERYQWLAKLLEDKYKFAIPIDLVNEVAHRVGIHGHFYTYLQKVVTTHFTYQYHHFARKDAEATIRISDASRQIAEAAQQDSSSMKTIAYLTLGFLPVTFICALFSTSVVNFENFGGSKDGAARVVSPGWWIFALCCVCSTAITFAIWARLVRRQRQGATAERKLC